MQKLKLAAAIAAVFPGIGPGQTPAVAFNGALPDQTSLINSILGVNPFQEAIFSAATNTTAFTAGGSQISGATLTVLNLTGTLGAGANLTLPTVANLIASLPALAQQNPVGLSWQLRICNSSSGAFAWTVVTATGWGTLLGTQTIAQNTFRDYIITITSATTATLQSIGGGSVAV